MTSDYFGQPGDSGWDGSGTAPKAAAGPHKHPLPIPTASVTTYDPSVSGRSVGTTQAAIDKAFAELDAIPTSGLVWFDVTNYGAAGDGTTDDTAAVGSAIAALNTAARGVLYFPAGQYKVTSALTTITAACTVLGDGPTSYDAAVHGSEIVCTSGTAVAMTLTGKVARVEKIGLRANTGGTPSAGSGLQVSSSYIGQRVDFEEVSVHGFYDNVDIQVGAQWSMHAANITGPVRYGVRIRNTVNGDAGDWSISDSAVYSQTYDATSGIRIESSGGGKIANVKINKGTDSHSFTHGVDLAAAGTTSVLLLANNSIENVTGDGIHVTNSASQQYGLIQIAGNQFGLYSNTTGHAISVAATASGDIYDVVIGPNLYKATGGNSGAAVALTNVDNVTILPGVVDGFGSLLATTTCTNVHDRTGGVGDSVEITGTPTSGQVPVASSGTAAAWGDVSTSITAAQVRDVGGHWEVVISGSSPPVAVTTEDGTDWVYGWVTG